MSTILATAVALCFIWSVVLFFAAVALREREQEDGFGWALGGAALFFVVFADRLPGVPGQVRDVISLLPGTAPGAEDFVSSMLALGLLLAVYAFRIAVFYELVLRDPDGSAAEERANDIVAPPLSYFCCAICVVALLQPIYGLTVPETVLISLGLLAAYYAGVVSRLLHFFQDFWPEVVAVAERMRAGLELVVQGGMLVIAIGEDYRRGDRSGGAGERAAARRRKIEERRRDAKARRENAIAKVAQRTGASKRERKSR